MKWGIYARNGFEGADAFAEGCLKFGHTAKICSVSDYGAGQTEAFDAIAVFGLQWKGAWVLRDYMAQNIRVYVIDYGYIKRTNHAHDWRKGHWQISLNGLNNIVENDNADRFNALDIQIKEVGGNPDGYTLICTQTTGDASHGNDEAGIQKWVNEQWLKHENPILRPHPLQAELTYNKQTLNGTLEQALSQSRLVVTMNSNTGHEALIQGVPVIATLPAAYSNMTGELPSLKARTQYFQRVANSQWTWEEMRQGLFHRTIC